MAILNTTEKAKGSETKGLTIGNVGENEIVLYGPAKKRDMVRRIIAGLDLPRPGVTTSFITPTVMGVAILYPTGYKNTRSKIAGRPDQQTEAFRVIGEDVKWYKDSNP